MDFFRTLSQTPLPTILVAAGILFLLLAVANQLGGKIEVPVERQKLSGLVGMVLLALGIALYVVKGVNDSNVQPPVPPNSDGGHKEPPTRAKTIKNVALNKAVNASRSGATTPPRFSVDGDSAQAWNAGDYPPQWVEVDLGAPFEIEKIRLTVGQDPAGDTEHLVTGRGPGEVDYHSLYTFSDPTRDKQVLEYLPPQPWKNIQFLKVETTKSPSWVSWREIEIFSRVED